MISALTLMVVLGLGAVSANAGFMISDRGNGSQAPCNVKSDTSSFDGIIIVGLPMLDGIIIVGRDGLMISDKGNTCQQTETNEIPENGGFMISD